MSLQLNTTEEGNKYQEFYGRNLDQMPLLISSGRTLMSFAQVMRRRLEAPEEVRGLWRQNYFDTGDASARNPNGKLKVVYDAQQLRDINPESKLSVGALVLENGVYEQLQGEEFSKKDLAKYTDEVLTLKQVKSNPIWKALAKGDQTLLSDYADSMFSVGKERFGYDEMMGIGIDNAQGVATMRPWFVGRLGGSSRSGADGWTLLGNDGGRLVGVEAPKVQSAPGISSIDDKVMSALNKGISFEFNGTLYAPIKKDSGLKLL